MLSVLATIILAASNIPDEAALRAFRGAIWADLERNAMIGNGNRLASLWYNSGSSDRPDLHIQNLSCDLRLKRYRCSFVLFRDGGATTVLGQRAPDTLRCRAKLEADAEEIGSWKVEHLPPQGGSHSRTSMICR